MALLSVAILYKPSVLSPQNVILSSAQMDDTSSSSARQRSLLKILQFLMIMDE